MVATSHALASVGAVVGHADDEIRARPQSVAVAQIPLELIVAPPRERAVRVDADDPDLAALAESLKLHGLLHPIGVRPLPSGMFELVYGGRRLTAARRLGWSTIACSLHLDLDEEPAVVAGLVENLHRRDLSPRQRSTALRLLASLHQPGRPLGGYSTGGHAAIQPPPRQPGSAGDLARRLGVDVSTIVRLAALGRDEQLLGLVEDGELGLTAASHIARVPLDLRRRVLDQVLQEHLSANATHQHVNRVLRERRVPSDVPRRSAVTPAGSLQRLKTALGILAGIVVAVDGADHQVILEHMAAQLERLQGEAAAACGSTTERALA